MQSRAPIGPRPARLETIMAQDAAPAPQTEGPEWEFELRMPDGRLDGLHHVYALQAMLYAGKLPKDCQVRRPAPGPGWPGEPEQAGEWMPLWALPDLKAVLDLQGIEYGQAEAERRIAGWQRSAGASEEEPELTQSPVTIATPPVMPSPLAQKSTWVPLVVGTVLLVLVLLVVGIVLAS